MMNDDEQLMLHFQDGSPDAFGELFDRYRRPIYGYFRRRVRDAARAEELMQDTFVALLRSVVRYEVRATFKTYLYSIALKILWTERRKSRGDHEEADDLPDQRQRGDPAVAIVVRKALDRIDPVYREVLMLREYEQLSYDEISEVLKVPVSTIRSRLFRARKEMKGLLDGMRLRTAA